MLKCSNPSCGLTEGDFGKCGSAKTCAIALGSEPVPVATNGRDVILSCDHCDERRVVRTKDLANATAESAKPLNCRLGKDACMCVATVPKASVIGSVEKAQTPVKSSKAQPKVAAKQNEES